LLGEGPALADEPESGWVADLRSQQSVLLRRARHHVADAMLRLGDAAGARELASAAIRVDRFDEAAHRVLMMAHRATGETASALVAYERLRSDLAEQLGVDPAPETRAVHQALLVEAPIDAPSPRITEPVLAGRSSELARLGAVWSAATDGRPGFVLLAGEGGIGKTRLADEFATSVEAAGARV